MEALSHPLSVNLSTPCQLGSLPLVCLAVETCSGADAAAASGSAAVGGAMGMLTSLTSVVQSTVSNSVFCLWRWKSHVFIPDAYQSGKFSCAKLFKIRMTVPAESCVPACKWLIQSHCPADIPRNDEF